MKPVSTKRQTPNANATASETRAMTMRTIGVVRFQKTWQRMSVGARSVKRLTCRNANETLAGNSLNELTTEKTESR